MTSFDPEWHAECSTSSNCFVPGLIACVAFVLIGGVNMFLLATEWTERKDFGEIAKVVYLLRRTNLLASFLMLGFTLRLWHPYGPAQLVTHILVTNASVLISVSGIAMWYEFFQIVRRRHFAQIFQLNMLPLSPLCNQLFWFPTAFLWIAGQLSMFAASLLDRLWPLSVFYCGAIGVCGLHLLLGWFLTMGVVVKIRDANCIHEDPWPELRGKIATQQQVRHVVDILRRIHLAVVLGTILELAASLVLLRTVLQHWDMGWQARYWSHYLSPVSADPSSMIVCILQLLTLLLFTWVAWTPVHCCGRTSDR